MVQRIRKLLVAFVLAAVCGAATLAAQAADATRPQTVHAMEGIVWAIMVPLGFITAICGVVYLGRALIEHRRWLQATRIQTEAHTKIVERLSSSEEMLAYLQTPGGQRLLSVTPLAETGTAAPVGRILWSVQTGIVLTLGGVGLWIGAGRALEELGEALRVVATLTIAVGIGFVASAAVSFVLSRHLGLLDAQAPHALR